MATGESINVGCCCRASISAMLLQLMLIVLLVEKIKVTHETK